MNDSVAEAAAMLTSSEREMTTAEFARENAGFYEHTITNGNPVEVQERYGFVVTDGDLFVGCSSGLASRDGDAYNPWFYLTDLFVEQPYRRRGLGAAVLARLEERAASLKIRNIWTWTAGHEASGFYRRQGYEAICELEDYYPSGHSRALWPTSVGWRVASTTPRSTRRDRPVPPPSPAFGTANHRPPS